ncbi:MAG: amino acid adenylation domain-containing protein [Acidobacteriia bacterium]|nr:amino acid adenylation domain-containing protein [Terriglobia bacterium]
MKARLQDLLTEQASRRADDAAIVFKGRATTYAELHESSNRLARALQDAGCREGDRVALLLPKSPDALIAMFAALKAGCMYVPLDCSSPALRLARILQICESRCVLAVQPTGGLLAEMIALGIPETTRLAWLDDGMAVDGDVAFTRRDADSLPPKDLDAIHTAADGAHILFTSGSTGTPKGVVITHANVLHFVDWAVRYFDIRPGDRLSGHPPLHFDLSTFDICGTIAAGAEIHLLPQELSLLPHRLAAFIRDSALTQWFSVPSILHHMAKFDAVQPHDFPSLKRLLWCGEKFPTPALMYWMQRLPRVAFTNLYGPTEATIASSFYRVPACPKDETTEVPIGEPCEGERLLVLDGDLQPCPPEIVGELYIAGAGLSPGYWRDEEKTAQAFIDSTHGRIYRTGDLARVGVNGMIYLVGRADTQIKSRGYRIELGEIEAAMHAIPGVQDAAVVAIDAGGFEGLAICCAYVGADLSPIALRRKLGQSLPHYMIPAQWMTLEQMPLNGNGKVARPRLKQMFLEQHAAHNAAVAPGVRA